MALPELTEEQRTANLKAALEFRKARAEIKKRLKDGSLTLAEVIAYKSKAAQGIKVYQAIKAMPGYGPKRESKLMQEIGISEDRRIHGLGSAQIRKLLEALGE